MPCHSAAPPCSASSTLDSKPYMCCGGTVAATGRGELDAAEAYRAEMWKRIDAPAKQRLKDAAEAAKKRLAPPPVERDEDGNPVLFAPGNDNAAR